MPDNLSMRDNATGTKYRRSHGVAEAVLVVVYGREGCPMCADAKQWLTERTIAFTFREIFRQPMSREELMALAAKAPDGLHELYAPKGARKVGLPDDARALAPDRIVRLQVGNPDLIRYPLLEIDNRLLFGFHQATRDALTRVIHGDS